MADTKYDIPEKVREGLLALADVPLAATIAEAVTNSANDVINDFGVNVATSLVARALVVNGILQVAADWMAMNSATPDAKLNRDALQLIVDDLPPGLSGTSEINPALLASERREAEFDEASKR